MDTLEKLESLNLVQKIESSSSLEDSPIEKPHGSNYPSLQYIASHKETNPFYEYKNLKIIIVIKICLKSR